MNNFKISTRLVILIGLLSALLIAIGGALGSVARYAFSTAVLRITGSLFPVGTFAVNVVGLARNPSTVPDGQRTSAPRERRGRAHALPPARAE